MPFQIPVKPEDLKWIYYKGEDAPPEGVPVGLWAAERSLATNPEALANIYKWYSDTPNNVLDPVAYEQWARDFNVGYLIDGWESDDDRWPALSVEQVYAIIATCLCNHAKDYDYAMEPEKVANLYHDYLTGERKATWKFPPDIGPEDVKWLMYREGGEEPTGEFSSIWGVEQSVATHKGSLQHHFREYMDERGRMLLAFENDGIRDKPEGVKLAAYCVSAAADQGIPGGSVEWIASLLRDGKIDPDR